MKKRLWDKGEAINEAVHEFTVGDDPVVDLELLPWDLYASAAHARMLESIGLISSAELSSLLGGLRDIRELHAAGNFPIPIELEDCHTTIENYLVTKLGDAGRRIHTGRSRNDQVLVMVRLYLKNTLLKLAEELEGTARLLLGRAQEFGHLPIPGYTHFQPAMPASMAMWLGAFAENSLSLAKEALALVNTCDENPLGVASGFGVPLPLDRQQTTKLLGFSRVQRNPIATQNSRGQYELKALRFAADISLMMEKFAWDIILFSSHEFNFIGLPTALTTGSSIMPQKRNPDVAELLRARAAKVRSAEQELLWVIAKLPSSYHRDFQYTKEPLVRGMRHVWECLAVFAELIRSVTVKKENLDALMTTDLYATYEVYREVRGGVPFREAYLSASEKIKKGAIDKQSLQGDFSIIANNTDLELSAATAELTQISLERTKVSAAFHAAIDCVLAA